MKKVIGMLCLCLFVVGCGNTDLEKKIQELQTDNKMLKSQLDQKKISNPTQPGADGDVKKTGDVVVENKVTSKKPECPDGSSYYEPPTVEVAGCFCPTSKPRWDEKTNSCVLDPPVVCKGDSCKDCPPGHYRSFKKNKKDGECCPIPDCDGGMAFDTRNEVCDCLAGQEWSSTFKRCVPKCLWNEYLDASGETCIKKKSSGTTTTGNVTTEPKVPKPPDDTYLKKMGKCDFVETYDDEGVLIKSEYSCEEI